MARGTPGRQSLRGFDDGVAIEAMALVEFGDGACLPERLHAKRTDTMAAYAPKPRQRGGVAVDQRHQSAMGRKRAQQALNVAGRGRSIILRFLRGRIIGKQPVGGCDRQQADIASILAKEARGLNRLRRAGPRPA